MYIIYITDKIIYTIRRLPLSCIIILVPNDDDDGDGDEY